MVILLNSQSTELIFRKYIMSVVWLLSNDLSRQKHKDVGLWRRYIHVIVVMGAMCAGNPPNFRPMMCNASVMVVRIWKLHSMHIFVPHLITLPGTNWIWGQHPSFSAIITHAWTHGAHSYMSYCGAIPGYYCWVFSQKTWTISRADIYMSWHNGSPDNCPLAWRNRRKET